MKFCKKCDKDTPTKIIGQKEECMVCGSIIQEYEIPKGKMINKSLMKDYKEITKINKDTGAYENAQKIGQNVLIGLLVILAGVLYSMGGFDLVFKGAIVLIIGLMVLAVALFLIAMASD